MKGNIHRLHHTTTKSCEICGYVHVDRHRIVPGEEGGRYVHSNVVLVCPNHHVAIHFLSAYFLATSDAIYPLQPGHDGTYEIGSVVKRIEDAMTYRERRMKRKIEYDPFYIRLFAYLGDVALLEFFRDRIIPAYIKHLNRKVVQDRIG